MTKTLTTQEFIEKAKEIHGDKYDYSKVDYINTKTKVIIICKIHGEFIQKPNNHISNKYGCSKCGRTKLLTKEEFIEKAKEVHGDKYDYSKVDYINTKTKVIIICKIHGEFIQKPNSHLINHGCPQCGINSQSLSLTLTKEEFIEKAKEVHEDKYDYSKVNYINSFTKVIIICKIHGEFIQIPNSHKTHKNGCPKCGINSQSLSLTLTKEEFIEKAKEVHGDKYDYSKVDYINTKTKVIIICKIHGEFKQIPHSHLINHGCSKCVNKTEGKVYNFLQEKNIYFNYQYSPEWGINSNNNKIFYDFFIQKIKTIIEIDGEQHFNETHTWYDNQHIKDIEKTKLANSNGIFVVRFSQEDIWNDNINWKEIINQILQNGLNGNEFISSKENKYNKHKELLNN